MNGPALTTTMREGGVAVVTFDLPGESVNKLTRGVVEEFRALMDRVDSDSSIRAVVLISGKPDSSSPARTSMDSSSCAPRRRPKRFRARDRS